MSRAQAENAKGHQRDRMGRDVVKVYMASATPEELAKMQELCRSEGWECHPTSGFGRRKGNYPVHVVVDAYERHKGVRAAARVAKISPGTAHRILREADKL